MKRQLLLSVLLAVLLLSSCTRVSKTDNNTEEAAPVTEETVPVTEENVTVPDDSTELKEHIAKESVVVNGEVVLDTEIIQEQTSLPQEEITSDSPEKQEGQIIPEQNVAEITDSISTVEQQDTPSGNNSVTYTAPDLFETEIVPLT